MVCWLKDEDGRLDCYVAHCRGRRGTPYLSQMTQGYGLTEVGLHSAKPYHINHFTFSSEHH